MRPYTQGKLDDFKLAAKENEDKSKHWEKELAKLCKEQHTLHGEADPVQELLTEPELAGYSTDAQHTEAAVLEDELAVMKPDMSSIEAFRAKETEYEERATVGWCSLNPG